MCRMERQLLELNEADREERRAAPVARDCNKRELVQPIKVMIGRLNTVWESLVGLMGRPSGPKRTHPSR